MLSIHKKSVEEYGKYIGIYLKTDMFTLKIEHNKTDHEVWISGKICKTIPFENQNLPKLEEFLTESVKEIKIKCGQHPRKSLDIIIRKEENPLLIKWKDT